MKENLNGRKRTRWLFLGVLLVLLSVGAYWFFSPSIRRVISPFERKDYRATKEEFKPAPVLKLATELVWQDVYIGDPLRLHVRLSSPRAMQEAHKLALKLEKGEFPTKSNFAPPVISSSTWPSHVLFRLFKVQPNGSPELVLPKVDWQTFRIARKSPITMPETKLGVIALVEEWIVPPDVFEQLSEGRYVLETVWVGKEIVESSLLDTEGKLKAAPLTFDIKSATDDRQRAAHAERLAHFEFQRGKYREARAYGQEALRLDPEGFSPQRAHTYLYIAEASIALGDTTATEATYRDLLKRLPPPERDDLAAAITDVLERLRHQK